MPSFLTPSNLLILFVAVTLIVNVIGWQRDRKRLIALRDETERLRHSADQAMDGILSDVAGRKEAERARHDTEQQLTSLVRNIPGVSFRCQVDEDWTMLFMSDAALTLTGYSPKEFVSQGRSFASLIHPDDRERLSGVVRDAQQAQRSYSVEYRIRHRDGHELWVWENAEVMFSEENGESWIDGVLLDVTETKLRTAEFESTLNAIGRVLSVIEFDMDGNILSANDNALKMIGYELDEVRGHSHRMFCDPAYADSRAYRDFWQRLGQGEFDAGEYKRYAKNGRPIWIQASYNPILDADGRPFKVVKLATDVSVRKEMEVALRDAKDRAERAAAAKTTFLANMSHEIRTPMNAVIGFTELLLDTPLDARQRGHLETVHQSARSLLGLLNDILDTAKLEKGVVELEYVDFSLRELCLDIASSLRLSAQAKNLPLEMDYAPGMGEFFKGDPLRIRQVLVNLLGNAIKFTERGSVRLSISQENEMVHLAIHDTGLGIAPDRIGKIFDRFAQADPSMTRRYGGTGLGTSIARQLVDLMGGKISVESELGVGSVFHVHLPLLQGEDILTLPAAANDDLPPLRILIADDVEQNVELLVIALGKLGHHVVSVDDGAKAVDAACNNRFDVILMDVQMPVLDGLAATRLIREHESVYRLAAVPIIALTASVQAEDRHATESAGMQGFASKPVEIGALVTEIARVVGMNPARVIPAADLPRPLPPESQDAEPAEAAQADNRAIDHEQGGFVWGSADALNLAIRRFLAAHADASTQLATQWNQRDLTAMGALAHRITGAAGNLALPALHDLAGQLEHALKHNELDAVPVLLSTIEGAFEAIRQTVDPMAGTAAAAPDARAAPDLARNAVQVCARRVIEALHRGALDDGALADLARTLRDHGWTARAASLEAAIADFDFDRAEGLLQPLLAERVTVEE
ncbi:PAS domain-containing protein [Pigmentiphaga aceris]|uniref:Sensory/regulatory protein RpfC n=1 Tax=Pigmentiphaga aceris TaxID=1940612 RepID=A0A5C0AUW4_9BURK|nr:PAS domain-containing protein [Pigmentiphaga aceris]QEI04700.1 PAS domain-containing protein [Pigmentiphaga aceris]